MRSVSVEDGLLISSKLTAASSLTPNPIREHAVCKQDNKKTSNKYESPTSLSPIDISPTEHAHPLPSIPEMEALPMSFLKGRSLVQLRASNTVKMR